MDDKVLIAVIAAGAAVIGGMLTAVIGPIIAGKLQHAAVGKDRKRAMVQKWRDMIHDIYSHSRDDQNVKPMILTHPDYLSLEPHLSDEARRTIHSGAIEIIMGNQGMAAPLQTLAGEVGRLEREWKLL